MDRFSPVAPAHIRVLVLPIGQIERPKYLAFLDRLKNEASIITLAEVEPHVGDHELLLSPKAFRRGSILYNYTTSLPAEHYVQLSPYELFRESLLVLGIKDGTGHTDEDNQKELEDAAEYLRERHPRVVLRQLFVLEEGERGSTLTEDTITRVQNSKQSDDSYLREAICEASARFLAELSTYTRAMQASPGIQTPGQTARDLQRTTSLKDNDRRPASGHKTPPQNVESSAPVDENGTRAPALNREIPATSFDQIALSHTGTNSSTRPDSQTSNKSKPGGRSSSQDRVSVQGFGSTGTSQEKLKHRGKARVGIVIGSIYLMAGQWSEALRILVDHTNKARVLLSDHLWHAKGLECIVVCMLLHAWTGLDFQIPSTCYPVAERTNSGHAQRFSVNLPSDTRLTDAAEQSSISRLSTALPDLLKLILSLYRSGEGSLELPFVCVSEVTIRFCKLLATLHNIGGEVTGEALSRFVGQGSMVETERSRTASFASRALSKGAIADMLSHAQPTPRDDVAVPDQVAILSGSASVYATLNMNRKKASVMKDLVVKLTAALTQARKRGAADLGIHPAASLSAEGGAEAIIAMAESSGGVSQMMSELASVYGMPLLDSSISDSTDFYSSSFGNDTLKMSVARDLSAFCEASPDPPGVLRLNASLLRWFGPNAAVDTEVNMSMNLSREEQGRLTTTISRTIGVSKQLGLSKIETTYWDPFIVRDVIFTTPDANRIVLDRSKLKSGAALVEQTPGNPLLYDPNASRSAAEPEVQRTYTVVQNEVSECVVMLQNPYDVSVDVTSLHLITEGVELTTSHQSIVLNPMRLQQVSLFVSPGSPGDCNITGCFVKISGCAEQKFPIVTKPWSPAAPTLVKVHGQEGRMQEEDQRDTQQNDAPEHATVSLHVIEPQPTLTLQNSSLLESSLMLLDGEKLELELTLRNTSAIAASVFDIVSSSDILRLQATPGKNQANISASGGDSLLQEPTTVDPGDSACFKFLLTGKPGTSGIQAVFYYSCASSATQHVRIVSVPIDVTVNAALHVQQLDIMPLDHEDHSDTCMLTLTIGNAWPKSLGFVFSITNDSAAIDDRESLTSPLQGSLTPGEVQRVHLEAAKVSADIYARGSPDAVRKSLLERLNVKWHCEGRHGETDLFGLTLKPEAMELLRAAPVDVGLDILSSITQSEEDRGASIETGSFAVVRAKLANRSASSTPPLLVQLHSRGSNVDSAQTHDERSVAIAGALHRVVRPLSESEEATVDFAICPLLSGNVQLEAVARPALESMTTDGQSWVARRTLRVDVV